MCQELLCAIDIMVKMVGKFQNSCSCILTQKDTHSEPIILGNDM